MEITDDNKLYKYRSDQNWEREIQSINENYFWAAKYDTLNDPTESFFSIEKLIKEIKDFNIVLQSLGSTYKDKTDNEITCEIYERIEGFKNNMGIFSLSKTFQDELLWAYYSNSHKGFCIEYEKDKLLDSYKSYEIKHFDVYYEDNPPNIDFKSLLSFKQEDIITKVLGTKSKKWIHEKEERIITSFIGKHPHKIDAITGIYFGINSSQDLINKIIEKTRYRGIEYYKMNIEYNTYKYDKVKIDTDYSNKKNYFLGDYTDNIVKVEYAIVELDLDRINKKGFAKIILNDKIDEYDLNNIANDLKKQVFWSSENICIWYFLKEIDSEIAWGTSNWNKEKRKFDNKINSEEFLYLNQKK